MTANEEPRHEDIARAKGADVFLKKPFEMRELLSAKVAGANTVIVGHAYPYFTLVGGQYLNEGEADVVQPRGTDFEVLARLGLKQWRDLATLPVRQ